MQKALHGHHQVIYTVAFHPDGRRLVSADNDGVIHLWDGQNGALLGTLRTARPYEHMNITNAKGLTAVQKISLKALGATEDEGVGLV